MHIMQQSSRIRFVFSRGHATLDLSQVRDAGSCGTGRAGSCSACVERDAAKTIAGHQLVGEGYKREAHNQSSNGRSLVA